MASGPARPYRAGMCRSALLAAALLATIPAAAQDAPPEVGFESLLADLTDLEALWGPPAAGEACVQFSSYDRRSDAGPADAEAWYANADRGKFLRTLSREGRTEHVLVDHAGPGAVVRIWSANPSGQLFFYFDGEDEPRWTVDFADLLAGRVEGLGEPLCGTRSRGGNCYLPIPFARHLVVTSDAADFYYQVNVRTLAEGQTTESFDPVWLTARRAAIDAAAARLHAGGAPLVRDDRAAPIHFAGRLAADGAGPEGVLWSKQFRGPGVLRGLRFRLGPAESTVSAADIAALRRTVRVLVVCDGEVTVDVPFADFFGSAPAFHPFGGLAIGVRDDGTGYCDFPMPSRESLNVALLAEGELPCTARIDGALRFVPEDVPTDALRFRASWDLEKDRRTRPFGDHLVLDASGGAGRYVGTTLVVRNPTRSWWGEGDEKITVDGEAFPSTFGTGTEDYFGYAWCCPDPFDHPLHAQPQADGPANFGYACNVRLHVADQVPFHESLRFDLEVWHWKDVVVDYATVAYWYGAPGTASGLPEMPPVEARIPVEMAPPVSFVAAGVLEGEALKILERTGGSTRTQDLSGFEADRWSRDAHLWWVDGAPGDRLVLGVPVEAAGRYRVQAALTTAPDYAIVKVGIDGQPLGDPIDLYTPAVHSTGLVDLGAADLEAGTAKLEIEITGRNEKAIPRHMVGIDYVKLVPVQ